MKEVYGSFNPETDKTADLHIHSNLSDRVLTPEQIVDHAHFLGMDAVALTDHDMVYPAEVAWEYAAKKGIPLELVIGSEITTETEGEKAHLIGLFLTDEVPKHQSVAQTLYQIHRQGGLAIVPHAEFLHFGFSSFRKKDLNRYINSDDPEAYFDGFEVSNGGLLLIAKRKQSQGKSAPRAYGFALEYFCENKEKLGAAIGGSDTHRITLGLSLTVFRKDLKDAIRNAETSVIAPDSFDEFVGQYQKANEFFQGTHIQKERSRHLF